MNQGRLFIRVQLSFIKLFDFELLEKFPDYNSLLRLVCRARFRTKNGFTEARHAIVDTGAHTSILPLSLWKRLDIKIMGEHYVRGLVPRKECFMNVKVGRVKVRIVDDLGNQTDEIKTRAFLAPVDAVPVIIGFKDLLEKFKVFFDPAKETGYIE